MSREEIEGLIKTLRENEACNALSDRAAQALTALLAENERLREALRDVADPLSYLRRMAEAQGSTLNGMAYQIANDPEQIKRIARAALNKDPDQ